MAESGQSWIMLDKSKTSCFDTGDGIKSWLWLWRFYWRGVAMRMRLLSLLLALFLLSGCTSTKHFLASSCSSVKEFLFPDVEPDPDPSPVNQWHLRQYNPPHVQTNRAIRERMRDR